MMKGAVALGILLLMKHGGDVFFPSAVGVVPNGGLLGVVESTGKPKHDGDAVYSVGQYPVYNYPVQDVAVVVKTDHPKDYSRAFEVFKRK